MASKVIRYDDKSKEEISKLGGPVVFLAGPTVRGHQQHLQPSWRFECIEEFDRQGYNGSLIIPEFNSLTESDKGKEWLPLWEYEGLKTAGAILFWIPRTRELIGLTTNWEFGYWMGRNRDKVIYGRPDDAYRIDYLDIMWEAVWETNPPPIHNTLKGCVEECIEGVGKR